MALFSERYGYTSNITIRKRITIDIQNAIINCFNELSKSLIYYIDEARFNLNYGLEEEVQIHFLNQERNVHLRNGIIINYLKSSIIWYKKLDLIEFIISFVERQRELNKKILINFIQQLNFEFKRLNFGYRIVGNQIIEITSDEETDSLEKALNNNFDNVRIHLQAALALYAKKPEGDYRNSIKESISAIEALSRNITGENSLNFKKMQDKGIKLPPVLRQAFEKLYGYTNDGSTGIRHALIDGESQPESEEALFMIISCSAFINYLNEKLSALACAK